MATIPLSLQETNASHASHVERDLNLMLTTISAERSCQNAVALRFLLPDLSTRTVIQSTTANHAIQVSETLTENAVRSNAMVSTKSEVIETSATIALIAKSVHFQILNRLNARNRSATTTSKILKTAHTDQTAHVTKGMETQTVEKNSVSHAHPAKDHLVTTRVAYLFIVVRHNTSEPSFSAHTVTGALMALSLTQKGQLVLRDLKLLAQPIRFLLQMDMDACQDVKPPKCGSQFKKPA